MDSRGENLTGKFYCKTSHIRPTQDHFGVILGCFWTIFGWIRGYLEISLASFWHHFGIILVLFWCRFEPILGRFRTIFGPFLGHFYGHFAIFLCCFGKLTATLSKMMQEKAKRYKFLPKIHQKKDMQNCAKKTLFSAIKHLFCLKKCGQNRHFIL